MQCYPGDTLAGQLQLSPVLNICRAIACSATNKKALAFGTHYSGHIIQVGEISNNRYIY